MTNEEQIRNPTGLETPMSFLRISRTFTVEECKVLRWSKLWEIERLWKSPFTCKANEKDAISGWSLLLLDKFKPFGFCHDKYFRNHLRKKGEEAPFELRLRLPSRGAAELRLGDDPFMGFFCKLSPHWCCKNCSTNWRINHLQSSCNLSNLNGLMLNWKTAWLAWENTFISHIAFGPFSTRKKRNS